MMVLCKSLNVSASPKSSITLRNEQLKKYWFHIVLMALIIFPIALLCILDYGNLEGYNWAVNPQTGSMEQWSNSYLNQSYSFDVTWKGRMFYLFFAWFMVIESAFGWQEINTRTPKTRPLIVAALICASIPTAYVFATNFFGLDLAVLNAGQSIGVPYLNASNQPSDFLELFWPLSVEYLVFFGSFAAALAFAYRPRGLKTFGISLTLLGAIGVAYTLDTVYPFGVFRPLQEIALPTTAATAALFDLLGYKVTLNYPVQVGDSQMPNIIVTSGGQTANLAVSWACAGVYSLLLYVLIILVFFKRSNITSFRKVIYFIIGLFGTFTAIVLRVFAITLVYLQQGREAGMTFHNTYGELFGFTWIFAFIMIIVCVERFSLVERTEEGFKKAIWLLSRKESQTT